ncbi:hypothetical protein [Pseudalkalibacillus salsuginis]|uniref:hypothetical protein n=1 Tax=Pseudalkalibacillus salsuginis TaxID=2910972 RepID=UPI001F47DE2C|nr:hypothetical protein [Pseudalkalibacillus salsuginis]MCF6409944.1 hypothetical protein [Pseudalkalibacillus salsuginis]
MIAFVFCLIGLYHYVDQIFLDSDDVIPERITFHQNTYVSTDFYIQTEASRPKPEFLPTGFTVDGEEYGNLNGGWVFQNPKTDEIFIKEKESNPTRYLLYKKK